MNKTCNTFIKLKLIVLHTRKKNKKKRKTLKFNKLSHCPVCPAFLKVFFMRGFIGYTFKIAGQTGQRDNVKCR